MRFLKCLLLHSALLFLFACSSGGSSKDRETIDGAVLDVTMSISSTHLSASAPVNQTWSPSSAVSISVNNMPAAGLYVSYQFSNSGIDRVEFFGQSSPAQLSVIYRLPTTLTVGHYSDTITISVCHDQTCATQIKGSPVSVTSSYTVTASEAPVDPDANLSAVPFTKSAALTHDVIDAEYSQSLNAVVMASTYPANRLYRYDVSTGDETFVALPKTPTAVSISPDGLKAAVGHDALISYVDWSTAMPALQTLNVSIDVLDVVLAANGFVYAFPRRDQWAEIHSIDIANNIETVSGYPSIYAGTVAKLHPAGEYMYGANNGLSPSDIEKYDIRSGTAKVLYDSPYHGDYAMCGNLWFNASGSRIYTACGNTFKATADKNTDMTYTGKIALSGAQTNNYQILSLSDNSATKSVALIEAPWYECKYGNDPAACRMYLRLHESDFLNLQTKYKFSYLSIAGNYYRQDGKFVFHTSSDNRVIVITKLHAMPNPDSEFFINFM